MWTSSYCFVTHAIQINLVSNFERSCNFPHRHKNSSQFYQDLVAWRDSGTFLVSSDQPSLVMRWSSCQCPESLQPRLRELMWTQPRRAFSMPGPARRMCYVTTNVKIMLLVQCHVRSYIKSLDKINRVAKWYSSARKQAGKYRSLFVQFHDWDF